MSGGAVRVVADAALVLGVLAQLVCCLGVWWMRDVLDRLHFAAAGSTVGPVLVAVAVALTGFSSASGTVQALVALAFVVVLGPVLTHATGRAARRPVHGAVTDADPDADAGPDPDGESGTGTGTGTGSGPGSAGTDPAGAGE